MKTRDEVLQDIPDAVFFPGDPAPQGKVTKDGHVGSVTGVVPTDHMIQPPPCSHCLRPYDRPVPSPFAGWWIVAWTDRWVDAGTDDAGSFKLHRENGPGRKPFETVEYPPSLRPEQVGINA